MRALRSLAALGVYLACAASVAEAADVTLECNYAFDGSDSTSYYPGSIEVDDLRTPAQEWYVYAAKDSYYEAGYADPHPDTIAAGASLTSVLVEVVWGMQPLWSGSLGLEAYEGTTLLGSLHLTDSGDWGPVQKTWDVTALINGRPDPLLALNDLRIRMVNPGGTRIVYWNHTKVDVSYSSSVPPEKPSITSPAPGATGVARDGSVFGSAFSDPNGDTHAASDWEVFSNPGLSPADRVASSLADTVRLTSIATVSSQMTFEGALVGKTLLAPETQYWVRARYGDDTWQWSEWSDAVGFTTCANSTPDAPSIVSPTQDATGVSRSPQIVASAFSDPDGDPHLSSDWEIFDDASLGAGNRVAYGLGDATNKTSITVDTDGFVFENALALQTMLAASTEYWARVTYRDACGATAVSSVVNFTTGSNQSPERPSIVGPSADAQDVSRNPTVTGSAYSDPEGDPHAESSWEVFEDGGLTSPVAISLNDPVNTTAIDLTAANVTFVNSLAGKTALAALTDYWVRVTYIDVDGGSATSLPVHFTTAANQGPNAPSIVSPAVDEPDVDRNPVVTSTAYSDPEGDPHASSDWEMYSDPGLAPGDRVAAGMNDPVNRTSIVFAEGSVSFEGALAGRTSLAPGTAYWVRVRYRDGGGAVGDWSSARRFTTAANAPPQTPTAISPAAEQTGVGRTPTAIFSQYVDPDADAHSSTDWEVFDSASAGPLDRVASSLSDADDLESIIFDTTHVVFENALAGEASLAPETDYWLRVTHRDEYGAAASSGLVHFVTGLNKAPSIPTIISPSPDSTGIALNPTVVTAPYNDPDDDAHASTSWEIYDDAGVTLVACSTDDSMNLTSIAVDPGSLVFQGELSGADALEGGTEYWARACFTDDLGATGDWSALTRFETGVYSTDELWPYYGSGCLPGQGRSDIGAWGGLAMIAAAIGLALRRGRRP